MEDEKKAETKKVIGINAATRTILSLGSVNFPSISLAISQKNTERVTPVDIRKPFATSIDTGTKGIKKNNDTKNVPSRV